MATTLATRKQSEAIRQRMQLIRTEMPSDADSARARVKELTDWKYHVRNHPLPVLAAAAVVGYLLVPSKSNPSVIVRSESQGEHPEPAPAKKGMLGGLLGSLATLAIKQGITLATRQMSTELFAAKSTPNSEYERRSS